jgi:signal transduction histidine kinase
MPAGDFSPYDRFVPATQQLTARLAAIAPGRQELLADTGLAVALSAVNAVTLLPYRAQLHPFWLALVLVIAQGLPLAFRRAKAVGTGLIVGIARVAYDRIGFGFAPFPLGPAIAVYTVADLRGRVWRYVAAALVVTGISLSLATPGHNEPYEAIFQGLIFLTAWVAGVTSRARRASLAAAEDRADRAEAEIDRQAREAAAAERARIARELHDVVAHHVSLIAVQAEAAGSVLPGNPAQAARSVDIIGEVARQALAELRRLLGVLRGPSSPAALAGLAPAVTLASLDTVLEQVRGAGLPVELAVEGEPYPLAAGVDLTAYRIVQEALTNTLRHSSARSAAVTLSYEPDYLTVRVQDPGPRLNGGAAARSIVSAAAPGAVASAGFGLAGFGLAGFGLAGIAERVASCGGNLNVGPTEPDGFAVTARLPAR